MCTFVHNKHAEQNVFQRFTMLLNVITWLMTTITTPWEANEISFNLEWMSFMSECLSFSIHHYFWRVTDNTYRFKWKLSCNYFFLYIIVFYLRNEFYFWKVHGITNTSGLLQSKWSPKGFTLTLQETRSIHDSINIPKIEFITYIYILYYQPSINLQFTPHLAGFPDILN